MLEWLGLRPLFDLDLRLGEGTGAALGISLADAACKILGEMATFDEAGVSGKA
jgi:nicotinate-nucleotide--dimethylbenzimidazole phosphoribosyltransferase